MAALEGHLDVCKYIISNIGGKLPKDLLLLDSLAQKLEVVFVKIYKDCLGSLIEF